MSEPVALHYDLDGPEGAPVVVLGSSIGTTAAMWEPQVPALARRYRVLRYDHRGHGRSPVPPGPYELADLGRDVLALLDRLGLDTVAFGGLSLGGMVAMWLGVHAPERVSARWCCAARRPISARPTAGWSGRSWCAGKARRRWSRPPGSGGSAPQTLATAPELATSFLQTLAGHAR